MSVLLLSIIVAVLLPMAGTAHPYKYGCSMTVEAVPSQCLFQGRIRGFKKSGHQAIDHHCLFL